LREVEREHSRLVGRCEAGVGPEVPRATEFAPDGTIRPSSWSTLDARACSAIQPMMAVSIPRPRTRQLTWCRRVAAHGGLPTLTRDYEPCP
jgi:hypothetical protein